MRAVRLMANRFSLRAGVYTLAIWRCLVRLNLSNSLIKIMANDSVISDSPSFGPQAAENPEFAITPEVREVLDQVAEHLNNDRPKQALEVVNRVKIKSPWLSNAAGVCQLRLGNPQAAVDIYRRLLLSSVGATLRHDAPTVFKVNYATALLADGDMQGCLLVLGDVKRDPHPAVQKLRSALDRSRQKLSLWDKLLWYTGLRLSYPVDLDFPLGDLE